MKRPRRFVFVDGREVEADSPAGVLEALRHSEAVPPPSLDRYLDLLFSRGSLGFGVQLDVGRPGEDLEVRCRRALSSLIHHGWLRAALGSRRVVRILAGDGRRIPA